MKHILFILLSFGFISFVSAQAKKPSDIAKFNSETVDLGKIKLGNPVTATFTVTNIGNEDMIIENVTPGCGCTKSDYTKEPIKPGKTGTITATYNAASVGNFSKSVYVKFLGIDEQKNLTIVGIVEQ
jgi:membrane carboxypeptidase/penicillin-binding protein